MTLDVQIINQSRELCGVLCSFLRSEGHRAECNPEFRHHECKAAEPQSGDHKLRSDLIIIEVAMPESKVMSILDSFRKSPDTRHIPIIVISDFAELEFELNSCFDFIMKPVDLGRLREDLSILLSGRRKRIAGVSPRSLNSFEHQLFHDFLIKHTGLQFERRNIKVLERAIHNRMEPLHIGSHLDYFEYLQQNMESRHELQKLLQLLTVGETFFFRYHTHFEALAKTVVKVLTATPAKNSLKIWSSGCSTGEEPYSIAMTIMESIPDWNKRDIKIHATDINNRSLKSAKDGVFNAWRMRVTPHHYINKYFDRIGESYIIKDEVKSLVSFEYCNLREFSPPGPGPFDIIFCRNVMIYFTTSTTKKVVEMFADLLPPGGLLFLGHSETLLNISSKFERHLLDGSFYYQKKQQLPAKPLTATDVLTQAQVKGHSTLLRWQHGHPHSPASYTPGNSPDDIFAKGLRLIHQECFAEAAEIFDEILRAKPEHTGSILAQGQIYLATGKMEQALLCFEKALEINDLLPEGYFLKGFLHEIQENSDSALEEYRKAILLKIDFVMPHYQSAKIHFSNGEVKSASRELRNCLRLLEKDSREAIIPFSGGLSREVFLEQVRKETVMIAETVID